MGRPEAGAVSPPTELATDAGSPVVRAKKTIEPAAPEARWESLIELRETGHSADEAPKVEPARRPPLKKWPIALAGSLFGLIALGVIVITIKDKNGATKVTIPDDKAVEIQKDDVVIEYKPSSSGRSSAKDSLTSGKAVDALSPEVPSPVNPQLVTNSLGMKLTLIPAGEFLMAAPNDSELAKMHPLETERARPAHKVRINRPFYLGVYEVTQEEYQKLAGVNPSHFGEMSNLPVDSVSWYESIEFCNRLSARENRPP